MTQSNAPTSQQDSGAPLKGWHVLMMMLGFFGVMFAVNGVFLYHAIKSFPGEDVEKSYVQGLNFNDTLAQRAAQAERGWTAEAGWQNGQLIFRLRDDAGADLSNLSVMAEVRRRATQGDDQAILFNAVGDGEYVVADAGLASGQWLMRIHVYDERAETLLFNVDKQIFVP
ncbi:MAG: FixH family protein [Pseudomonadota bacterium]